MSIERHIDPDSGRITLTASGPTRFEDLKVALKGVTEAPDFRPGADIIWDFRNVESEALTADQLREMVAFVAGIADVRGINYKVAIVVERNVDFGLARMYEVFADELPCELRVFRDLEEAVDWMAG